MKSVIFIFSSLLLSYSACAQTFFIEKTEKGYESKISEKLKYEGFKTSADSTSFDYRVQCLIRQTSKLNSMYKGYILITDKSGKEVARSKEVRRGAVAVNGFNAGNNIFSVIADKELPAILEKLRKQ